MTDAAFVIAPMASPPRPKAPLSSEAQGDFADGGSDFGAALQANIGAQDSAPPKSNAVKKCEDASPAATQDTQEMSAANQGAGTAEAKPSKHVRDAKPSSHAKAAKANKKNGDDDQSGASAEPASQALPAQSQIQASDTPRMTADAAKSDDAGTAVPPAPDDGAALASASADTPADPVKAAQSEITAALAQAGPGVAPETNGETRFKTAPAAAPEAEVTPSQAAGTRASHAGAAHAAQASIDAFKAAVAQATAPTDDANSKGAAAKSAEPDKTAATQSAATEASPTADKVDPAKSEAAKSITAATNANALLGILAATGAPDSQASDSAKADAGSVTGKAAPAIKVGATAVDAGKPQDKPVPAVPKLPTPNADTREAFDQRVKDGPSASQPANAAQIGRPANADPALPASGAANASAPSNQPPTQNAAVFAANIVDTTTQASSPATIHAQMDGPRLTLPADQIALEIRRHTMAGADHFNIKIDPPELGRIDVKIEMSSDGQTKAHLSADRQDTLDLLQRDSKLLERALNSNGLKTDRDSLNFSLRQDTPSNQGRNGGAGGNSPGPSGYWDPFDDEVAEAIAPVRAGIIDPTRIDILI